MKTFAIVMALTVAFAGAVYAGDKEKPQREGCQKEAREHREARERQDRACEKSRGMECVKESGEARRAEAKHADCATGAKKDK